MTRTVVGCMTGTSCDALDAAVLSITGHGLGLRAEVLATTSHPLGDLGPRLRAFARGGSLTAEQIARLAHEFAQLHTRAISAALAGRRADLVAIHGQTVFHAPPLSWQLIDPAPIAEALNTRILTDLRAADLAAGGQGAPITPLADWLLLRSPTETRVVLNLGGFANASLLPVGAPPEQTRGFDVCACNQVLDAAARSLLGHNFDPNGAAAMAGSPIAALTKPLRAHLAAQSSAGRSLGSLDEPESPSGRWLAEWLQIARVHPAPVALRSACAAIGSVIADALRPHTPQRLLLGGGGARNAALVAELSNHLAITAEPTDAHGVPADFREAIEMGVLGTLCDDAIPITIPAITRCTSPAPISGRWTLAPRP